ncbi:hypothetical protein NHX12_032517 [Muraenolepis orangiensis]|uniref:Uncharacterized protein n=1 Tax=Muraenolepis orangiensis TaxID=630683 RepID=A0A9Q0E5X9_9TELE|nr:hypothetical protein NHX12_032517 [Muraenolepis orangiensis]
MPSHPSEAGPLQQRDEAPIEAGPLQQRDKAGPLQQRPGSRGWASTAETRLQRMGLYSRDQASTAETRLCSRLYSRESRLGLYSKVTAARLSLMICSMATWKTTCMFSVSVTVVKW